MSAPRTDVETQTRWHRGPIIGMIVVVVFALSLLFWQMIWVADEGTPAGNGVAQIDGRTGVPDAGTPPMDGTTPDGDVPTVPDGDVPTQTPPPPPAVPDTDAKP